MKLEPDLPFNSMSVRDFIAMQAMQANIWANEGWGINPEVLAKTSIKQADALIAELQKQDDEHVDRRHD